MAGPITRKVNFLTFGVLIVVLSLFISNSEGVRVTFCSGLDLSGSCATKNVEIGMFRNKCEDFPFRFRWFYTARSVKVEGSFFGGCAVCRLHTSDRSISTTFLVYQN